MKKTLLILITLTLLTTGCMQNQNTQELTYDTPEQFELTTKPQDAVFFVAFGWVGGPAGDPIIDMETKRPLEMEGKTIFLDDDSWEELSKMAEEKNAFSTYMKVSANITLSTDASGNIILPPMEEDGGMPVVKSREYVSAHINQLNDVLPTDQWQRELKE